MSDWSSDVFSSDLHFGRRLIRTAWIYFVLPALMLNYLGQGVLLIGDPEAIQNPFYRLAPDWFRLQLVIVATLAALIRSEEGGVGEECVSQCRSRGRSHMLNKKTILM